MKNKNPMKDKPPTNPSGLDSPPPAEGRTHDLIALIEQFCDDTDSAEIVFVDVERETLNRLKDSAIRLMETIQREGG